MQASLQLVDDRGRKYLTADERQRFIRPAAHVRKPVDQTFVLTIAHTGARVSEVLALRALDVDLDAGAVRIRTLKRRVEHWREVPVPPELARDLEMVHCPREASPRRVGEPLWKFSRATAHRKVVAVMRMARISHADALCAPFGTLYQERWVGVPGRRVGTISPVAIPDLTNEMAYRRFPETRSRARDSCRAAPPRALGHAPAIHRVCPGAPPQAFGVGRPRRMVTLDRHPRLSEASRPSSQVRRVPLLTHSMLAWLDDALAVQRPI